MKSPNPYHILGYAVRVCRHRMAGGDLTRLYYLGLRRPRHQSSG